MEPSDVLYLPTASDLLVASDTSMLCYVAWNQSLGANLSSPSGCRAIETNHGNPVNLEGLALHPKALAERNVVYLGREIPPKIYEFSLTSYSNVRKFDLSKYMKTGSNAGLEGLVWVPDDSFSTGGYFIVANQNNGKLYSFAISADVHDEQVYFLREWDPPIHGDDISGLYYRNDTKRLFAVSDKQNVLVSFDVHTGASPLIWSLKGAPTKNEEGVFIFVDQSDGSRGTLVVADDSGSLWRANIGGMRSVQE